MAGPTRFDTRVNTAARKTDESWKAQGFLNFSLMKAGSPHKIGAIPLKISNPDQKALIEWLSKAPETNASVLKKHILITFNEVTTEALVFDDLPGLRNTGTVAEREEGKPDGYLNVAMVDEQGNEVRLGFLPLHKGEKNHANLLPWLSSNPEEHAKLFGEKVVLDYRSTTKAATASKFTFMA